MEIKNKDEDVIMISDFHVEYDQAINEIFFQVHTELENELIELVNVKMNMDDDQFDEMVFSLNDLGNWGDLIPLNGIFSRVLSFDENLTFGEYELEAMIQTISGENENKIIKLNIEEQFAPEIIGIKFWKKNKESQGYEFNPEVTEFQVNDNDSSFLDIQVEIKDLNGKDDIDFIRYQVNVEGMAANDSCDYVPESGFQSYAQWYLNFHSETDSSFIYDINNYFLSEPGITIKPIDSCGRTGVSIFRFIISDYFHDAIIIEIPLAFIQCGDNSWDCDVGSESDYCIEECNR